MARDDVFIKSAGKWSLFSFGDSTVGLVEAYDKVEFTRKYLEGISRASSVLCKSATGGYLTNKLKTAYIGMVKMAAMQQSGYGLPSWAEYDIDYAEWKNEKGYGSKKWIRTGSLLNQVGVINRKASGLSVGFKLKAETPRRGYNNKTNDGTYKAQEIAKRMEFGWHSSYTRKSKSGNSIQYISGMPPRPLFMPVALYFAQSYIPHFADYVAKSLRDGIEKHGLKNDEKGVPSRAKAEAIKVFAEMDAKIKAEMEVNLLNAMFGDDRTEKEEDWNAVFAAAVGSVV